MRLKMMALAAVPVAGLLAGGGMAVAQASTAHPATAVVHQVRADHPDGMDHGRQMRMDDQSETAMKARHDGEHGKDGNCDAKQAAQRQSGHAGAAMTPPARGSDHMDQ